MEAIWETTFSLTQVNKKKKKRKENVCGWGRRDNGIMLIVNQGICRQVLILDLFDKFSL